MVERTGVAVPHIRTVHACARLLDHLSGSKPAGPG
jgi:hypothetical protein